MSKLALLRGSVLGLAFAMSIPWIALADDYTVDNSDALSGNQNSGSLTTGPGATVTVTETARLVIEYQGNDHLIPGSAIGFSYSPSQSTLPNATVSNPSGFVPADWGTTTVFTLTATVSATFTASASGGSTDYTVKWDDTTKSCPLVPNTNPKKADEPPAQTNCLRGAAAFVFNVTVDATPPSLTVPSDISVPATSAAGATVTYAASATDDRGTPQLSCVPASGSTFPAGRTTLVTCTATDAVGNTTVKSFNVVVGPWDTTPPVITPTISPAANANGWHNGDATVSWTVTDAESAFTTTGCATTVLTGSGSLTCSATSDGGTSSATVSVQIDALAPTIIAAATTSPNEAGWYKSDVTIAFTCADTGGSGLDGSCPTAQTLSASGSNTQQTISDLAGNSATSNIVAVKVDQAAPAVTAGIAPAPNANGWNNTDVTVTFTCTDALSGCTSESESFPLSSEGTTALTSSEFGDFAGNGGATGTATVKIDKTAPTIDVSASAGSAAYGGGWTNQDVVVSFTCSDDRSGVAGDCPSAQTLTGSSSSAAQTIQDNAGNSATSLTIAAQIDKIAPTISAAATTGAGLYTSDTWTNQDVTVAFTCDDQGGSGLAGVCPGSEPFTASGSSSTPTVSDNAGNTSAPSNGFIVKIDKAAPSITGSASGANAAGWASGPVSVAFDCADTGGSGLASCGPNAIVSTEGANQSVTGTASDNAGNQSATTVAGINIDLTAPALSVTGQGPFGLGSRPTAQCTDALSGMAGAPTWTTTGGDVNGFGLITATVTCADKAGNVATTTFTYNVTLADSITCFISPIKTDQTYTAKAGSTIPMKCLLTAALVAPEQVQLTVVVMKPDGQVLTTVIDSGKSNGNGTTMRYTASMPGYIFNWQTTDSQTRTAKPLALGLYKFTVTAGGIVQPFEAKITLTK